jgi:hypothetical protein
LRPHKIHWLPRKWIVAPRPSTCRRNVRMSSEGDFLIVGKEAFHRPITLIWRRINEIVMKRTGRLESMRGKDGWPSRGPKILALLCLDIKGCIRMSPRISHSSEIRAAKMNLPGDKTFRMLAALAFDSLDENPSRNFSSPNTTNHPGIKQNPGRKDPPHEN